MRIVMLIVVLLLFPISVFGESGRLGAHEQLRGFLRLSQGDLEINAKSAAAAEKETYAAMKAADSNTDGVISYAEYLGYINKRRPGSVSMYDAALSALLPGLRGFFFHEAVGIVGAGILSADYEAGNVHIPAGAKITIVQDALLVNVDGSLSETRVPIIDARQRASEGAYSTPNLANGFGVIRFIDTAAPNTLCREGFSLLHGALASDAIIKGAKGDISYGDVAIAMLDETYAWFRDNPPGTSLDNFEARREKSAILDQLAFETPALDLAAFSSAEKSIFISADRSTFTQMEGKYPILYYLRMAQRKALEEVASTAVVSGVRIWKMYNMGIIVKTPDACFAIDLLPMTEDCSKILDFLVVSHEHEDHASGSLILEMMRKGKAVFRPSFSDDWIARQGPMKTTVLIDKDTIVKRGAISLKFKMSRQFNKGDRNYAPCLITTVDCGPATGNFSIMHIGDVNHEDTVPADTEIDFMDVSSIESIPMVHPRYANIDHKLELNHGIGEGGWRMSYENGYQSIVDLDRSNTGGMVLTWGEALSFN